MQLMGLMEVFFKAYQLFFFNFDPNLVLLGELSVFFFSFVSLHVFDGNLRGRAARRVLAILVFKGCQARYEKRIGCRARGEKKVIRLNAKHNLHNNISNRKVYNQP